MKKFLHEYRHFLSYPRDIRILLLTNLIYAFVLPVIDVFVGAYVMRNSHEVKMVVIYQLAVYTGIPLTFFVNGFLLQHVNIKRLYSAGMLLSGIAMAVMMSLGTLSMSGVGVAAAGPGAATLAPRGLAIRSGAQVMLRVRYGNLVVETPGETLAPCCV
ncbi:MAG: hypothetical protein NT154_12050, partial [Verrucomicrobia bacterium]|nr:hypothetical protein [Verrucomicrobiota bacterium]